MGFSARLKELALDREQVAFRPAANYANGFADPIFTIVGGPVLITAIFCRFTAAETTSATMAIDIEAVQMQTAALDVDGAINTIAVWPLEDTALSVIIPGVLASRWPLAGVFGNDAGFGVIASPGDITLTVGAADTDGLPEFFVIWKALTPASNIVVA